MCGFCGILAPGPPAELRSRVTTMTASLAHRGPDADGLYVGEGIALGHRRLSVIDLTAAGAQPMTDDATGVCVAYNGEVYNFRELRRELSAAGVGFAGTSDTEVLLRAYTRWGLDGLRRLEGIFGFALWDPARRRLVLMRDRLGVKPLFYARSGETLAFGSEIKALWRAGVDADVDRQALREYLWFGNAYEDRTIYRSVRSLPPGHWLLAEDGRTRIEPYWRLEDWLTPGPPPDEREAAAQVRHAVDTAVARQLVADVPVGVFLSGGIDSSSIAASAAHASGRRLSSYSVGFDFTDHADELPAARRLAADLGLDHHELHVSAAHLGDVLERLADAHDEPFADAANIPLFLLADELGGAVKVVLQGDGGDEVFGGYRRYSLLRHARPWRAWPRLLTPALRAAGPTGRRAARVADALGRADPAERMALLLTLETGDAPPEDVLTVDARRLLVEGTDPFLAYRHAADRFAGADPVQRMLLTDLTLQLPSQFLPKVDRATMAHGLEARVPLLDEGVAGLAVGLPSGYKVRGREKKVVLRDAMRGRVPDAVLDAPKRGFGVPFDRWLQHQLHAPARAAVLAQPVLDTFGLDRRVVAACFEQHRTGERDRGPLLWKLYQLALWHHSRPRAAVPQEVSR
ncbi:asparagine synthase (glutamine-hydrolyzing) [Geodermatophilus sp. CPCC 206100]